MLQQFTDALDVLLWCEQGRSLEGDIPLAEMARLYELLLTSEDAANFKLSFTSLGKKQSRIEGRVCARLTVLCQCCLESMIVDVDHSFVLQPVNGLLEAEQLSVDIEPLLLEDDVEITVAGIIEDELLLALPMSPKHDEDCNKPVDSGIKDDEMPSLREEKKENPFAVLASIRKTD